VADYLTRGDIVAHVQDLIDDDSSQMKTMIERWINLCWREVWNVDPHHGPLWAAVGPKSISLTAGTSCYNMSAFDPGRIYNAKVQGYSDPLEPAGAQNIMNEHYWNVEVGNGTPKRFRFRRTFSTAGAVNAYIDLFPAPDSTHDEKKLYFWYTPPFSALNTSAVAPQLPPEFHDVLIYGAAKMAAVQTVDAQQAGFAQMYERRKKDILRYNLTLIPEAGRMVAMHAIPGGYDNTRGAF